MPDKIYDWEDLDNVFRPIAEESPDRVTRSVYYHWNGDIPEKPCCAVAVVFDGLGDGPVPVLPEDDRPGISPEIQNLFRDLTFAGRFTSAGRQYLMTLQFMQDTGLPWSRAREKAVARAKATAGNAR